MIDILQAPDHVFAVRLSGVLGGADFDVMEREIEARIARHGRIGIAADISGFSGVTPQALLKDLRYNLAKLGHWDQFPREAVVTDTRWIAALAEAVHPFIPKVQMRAFKPEERDAAIAWAGDFPGAPDA